MCSSPVFSGALSATNIDYCLFLFLTGKQIFMAGKIIDMSTIKQILQLNLTGLFNRQIAKELHISRDKVNEYSSIAGNDRLGITGLIKIDDPVLERRFHPGNPAYSDKRMDTFIEMLLQSEMDNRMTSNRLSMTGTIKKL
jgi:hypothetical protein